MVRVKGVFTKERIFNYKKLGKFYVKRWEDLEKSKMKSEKLPIIINHLGEAIGYWDSMVPNAEQKELQFSGEVDVNRLNALGLQGKYVAQLIKEKKPLPVSPDFLADIDPTITKHGNVPIDGAQKNIIWEDLAIIVPKPYGTQTERCPVGECYALADGEIDIPNVEIISDNWLNQPKVKLSDSMSENDKNKKEDIETLKEELAKKDAELKKFLKAKMDEYNERANKYKHDPEKRKSWNEETYKGFFEGISHIQQVQAPQPATGSDAEEELPPNVFQRIPQNNPGKKKSKYEEEGFQPLNVFEEAK